MKRAANAHCIPTVFAYTQTAEQRSRWTPPPLPLIRYSQFCWLNHQLGESVNSNGSHPAPLKFQQQLLLDHRPASNNCDQQNLIMHPHHKHVYHQFQLLHNQPVLYYRTKMSFMYFIHIYTMSCPWHGYICFVPIVPILYHTIRMCSIFKSQCVSPISFVSLLVRTTISFLPMPVGVLSYIILPWQVLCAAYLNFYCISIQFRFNFHKRTQGHVLSWFDGSVSLYP